MNDSIIYLYDIILLNSNNKNIYDSPVIAAFLGFLLASLTGFVKDHYKEKGELENYENMLLRKTKDLIESDEIEKVEIIDKFVANIYTDLRFARLGTRNLISESLEKTQKGLDCRDEKSKIESRLEELRDEKILHKHKNKIVICIIVIFLWLVTYSQ